jgi:hypothetical protein
MLAFMPRYDLALSTNNGRPKVVAIEGERKLEVGSEVWVEGRRWRVEGFDEELGHLICLPVVRRVAEPA